MKKILIVLLVGLIAIAGYSKKENSGKPNPTCLQPATTKVDTNEVRGVWLTNTASTALDSRENIKETVTQCKAAGINNIFMVVYNNTRTLYPSKVMQNLIGVSIQEKFAGRDPLQELIEEAKLQNIKVHAWFEYGFSSSYSASGGAIVAAKPNWAAKDVKGNLVVKNGFDWLNGFHPEVQDYIMSLIREVVNNYDIDGIQGDDRLPALPSTAGYDDYTVTLYKSEHAGQAPPALFSNEEWVDWRAKKLNLFMKRIWQEVKTLKPEIRISMSPSVYPWGKTEYLQDWPAWVDSGWVDAIIPQVYRYNISAYSSTLTQQKQYIKNKGVAFFPGVLLRVGTYIAPESFLTQMIRANRNEGFKGEVFFFYEGMKERTSWFQSTYHNIK